MIEIRYNKKQYLDIKKLSYINGKIVWIDKNGKVHNTKKEYTKIIIHHYI